MKIELAVSVLMIVLGAFLFTYRGADDLIGKIFMSAGALGHVHVFFSYVLKNRFNKNSV